ncbi:FxSxx-COOH system tetratricopeptide repeat protein (plasmid) [Streptomyces sp. BI20]|uniref:FxSxx-COOH system tetratricopeptide repeat protein n=1 Tax=Streptomyces sp. BI20 TaxID=3403460 RepID=UPI003C71F289
MTPSPVPRLPGSSFAVFATTAENLGLSTTLRNTADILAEGNRSVLLVDGRGGEVPGAHTGPVPEPRAGRVVVLARSVAQASALTRDPIVAHYDHVLVEAPVPQAVGSPEIAPLLSAADVLVVCFALTAWSIDGAAALAEDLSGRRAQDLRRGPVRLLTVGLKSDIGVRDRLRVGRERVRRKFAPLAQARGERELPYLEIPYNPLYLDARALAVETEDAGSLAGLRPSYDRLADLLRAADRRRITDAVVVHSGRHAPWAAWLRDRLADKGVPTELRRADTHAGAPPEPGTALLFLSPGDTDEGLRAALGALSHADVRIVLVDEPFPDDAAAHHERVDLRGASEPEALRLLCAGLGLDPTPVPARPHAAPFPRLPDRANLRPRAGGLVDRDGLVIDLAEALGTAAETGAPLVLHGPSGWGKSETARDLCHRFGPGYEVVWWIRAWDRRRAVRDLADLADRLGVTAPPAAPLDPGPFDPARPERPVPDAEQPVPAAVRALLAPPEGPPARWLLVYDGAPDAQGPRGLMPAPGPHRHVLVTTRVDPPDTPAAHPNPDPAPEPGAPVRRVMPPLTADECRALLTDHVPELTVDQSRRVGHTLDFVPLALHLAAHCLAERAAAHRRDDHHDADAALHTAVADLLAEHRAAKIDLLAERGTAAPVPVMVRVARRIAETTPGGEAWRTETSGNHALRRLADAAALLTGRGAGLDLLRHRGILSELARDDSAAPGPETDPGAGRHPDEIRLPDEHMVSVALWSLARVGLLDVDFARGTPPAQHHAVRDAIRADTDPAARARAETVLRGVLADYHSRDEDLPADWAREVHGLRMWEDPRPRVRRALLRHLNSLSARAEATDLARLLDIADHARRAWAPTREAEDPSPEYLRLLNLVARAHRLGGSYARAHRYAREALRGHRRTLGLAHPRTLLSADSHAASLRALGRFDEALAQIRPAAEGLDLLLGRHHPATVQITHNLALTEALTGRVAAGLARVHEVFRHRQDIGGEDDPAAWEHADLLAFLYRSTGRSGEARDLLRQRLRRIGDGWDGRRLWTEVGLAICERRVADSQFTARDPRYGFEMALERDRRALAAYTDRFGPDRYETLRCRFSLAADLHALGKADEAERQARRSGDVLAERFGTAHPFTALNDVRHGVYLRALGELDGAREAGRTALDRLALALGLAHPWVAAAENSLAATLAALGRTDEAVTLAEGALTRLDDLGVAHRPNGRRIRAHLARLNHTDPNRTAPPGGFDIDLEL